jgi:hypothetical protein
MAYGCRISGARRRFFFGSATQCPKQDHREIQIRRFGSRLDDWCASHLRVIAAAACANPPHIAWNDVVMVLCVGCAPLLV